MRGDGPFTVETRVTLAHELTHVLQDQHFDLQKLDKAGQLTSMSDVTELASCGRWSPDRRTLSRRHSRNRD